MADTDVAGLIRDRAEAYGVSPDVLLRIGQVESGLNPNAAAGTSSAKGLFQFTDPTWKQYGNGADPLDPYANADAGARLLRDNGEHLRSVGIEPTPGNVYLAHFAGRGGAAKLLQADPSTPAGDVMGPQAVAANPFLRGMTVNDLRNWASRKMGGGQDASAAPAAEPPAQPTAAAPVMAPMGLGGPPAATGAPQQQQASPFDAMTKMGMGAMGGGGLPGMPGQQQGQQADQGGLMKVPPINFPVPQGIARARLMAAMQRAGGAA